MFSCICQLCGIPEPREKPRMKKQTHTFNPFLGTKSDAQLATVSSSGDENWTRKVERVDLHGVGVASNEDSADRMIVHNLQRKEGTTRVIVVL